MATRESRRVRADRETRLMLTELGTEFLESRVAAGLSLGAVGDVAGLSGSQVSRLEHALIERASVHTLNRIAHATGNRLSVKLYPADDPIRDVAHARLLERLRVLLHPRLRWTTEVPLPGVGLRGWDAVVDADRERTAIEGETRIRDTQALDRRIQRKVGLDPRVSQLVLLVADTRANRAALEVARESLRGNYPLDTREILDALRHGRHPTASGIAFL